MIISLIGMSNAGKTYWSKKLEAGGFTRFSCDDIIEKKLEKELKKLGFSGINDIAKWMGQPYETQYPQTSKKYLEFEKESLEEIIKILEGKPVHENIVIDTTGSVIYAGNGIMKQLRRLSKIVYLDIPESVKRQMRELYFQNPKPVIWGGSFKKAEDESDIEALKRCYPHLLEYRTNRYKEVAHLKLDYFLIRKPGFTIDDFLRLIRIGLDS